MQDADLDGLLRLRRANSHRARDDARRTESAGCQRGAREQLRGVGEPGGTAEAIGLGVAAVVLILTFGSLVAAGLPLITAVAGIVIGALGIAIATGFMELSSMTYTLAVMIGLAVNVWGGWLFGRLRLARV